MYGEIASRSRRTGLSMNEFLLNAIESLLSDKRKQELDDMDDLFGSWTDDDVEDIAKAIWDSRRIDKYIRR